MNSSGRFSLIWVSVLTLVMAGLFVGATASAQLPSATATSFYTSFGRYIDPDEFGGPYIIAATWDPDGDGGDGELRLVFSEPIDAATFEDPDAGDDNYDFLPIGWGWADGEMPTEVAVLDIPSAGDQRVVALRGFSATNPPAAGDSIALSSYHDFGDDWTDGVADPEGTVANDRSRVPIVTGPVMVSVTLSNDWFAVPMSDTDLQALDITVVFDHDIVVPNNAVENIFDLTPELSDATGGLVTDPIDFTYDAGGDPNELVVTWNADAHFRYLRPGWSKLWLREGLIEWDTATGALNVRQNVMLDNVGPNLLGATYISGTSTLWLTFDEPLDPAYVEEDLAGNPQYTLAGGGAAFSGGETQSPGFSEGFPNSIKILDAGFAYTAETSTIQVDHSLGGADLVDYQFVTGPSEAVSDPVPIYDGIMILRASYDVGGGPGVADDVLRITFSEGVNLIGAIDKDDFEFLPSEFNSLWDGAGLAFSYTSQGGHGVVEVTGWDQVNELDGGPLPTGLMIKLDAVDNDIKGLISGIGATANTAAAVPVVQDIVTWPLAPLAEEVTAMVRKYYSPGPPVIDEAYLAWREPGADDLVDSWLLFSSTDANNLTQTLINNYADEALPVSNLRSQIYDSGVQIVSVSIAEGQSTTDGTVLANGDEVFFMLVPTVYTGSIGTEATALKFGTPITVGPPCPPIDFSTTIPDDDMIHVRAVLDEALQEWTYTIWGDPGSAPCGDSVFVSDDAVLHGDVNRLGAGLIAGNRSFGPITLTMPDPVPSEIYVFSRLADQDVWSDTSEGILVDTVEPTLALWNDALGRDVVRYADRFNPLQIYTEGDYINILLQAHDGVTGNALARSGLMEITADFSEVNVSASVTGVADVTAVPFVSLGADQIDNDGDWVAMDPAIDRNLNGVMDFPEPYFDEDGDGLYTPGETFIDRNNNGWCDAPRGDGAGNPVADPAGVVYDLNLDSADPEEHGWYEIQLTADYNDLTKGFPLEDAVTDPTLGFGELFNLEVFITVADTTMDLTTAYDGVDEDPAFYCEVDEVAPSVVKITELQVTGGLGIDPATVDNVIVPTDPTYHLGRFVNFKAETPSDDDVLFGVTQIYTDRTGGWAWEALSVDPPGDNGDTGYPGVANFDDDGDALACLTNGLDDDEDGVIDNPEEGIDLHDPEVVDAMQDSLMDAQAAGGDGIYRQTDLIDNDNDAFFVFEPYFDNGGDVFQRVIFYNIDESTTNNIDDDGDGAVDEADEVETYDPDLDDNEDGMIDGQTIELTADGVNIVAAFDPAYGGPFYVDAAHVLGEHPADADGDIRAITEFIEPGHAIVNEDLFPWTPGFPGMDWGPGTAVNNELDWYASHSNENIDFEYFAKLYGMTADGSTEYQLRVLAYDQAGLVNPANSYPITFTLDVTWPEDLTITNCADGDPETGPADFEDVLPGDGLLQVYDGMAYTLTVENDDEAAQVLFQYRESEDEGATWSPGGGTFGAADGWGDLGGWDDARPFTDEYVAALLDNDPPANSLMVEFRAVPMDEFGNVPDLDAATDPDSVCVFPVTVIDGTPPLTAFTLIFETENPTGPAPPDPLGPYDPYWYRDVHGPVQVPAGPVIDVWAWYDDQDGDPATNDVARMLFEYREVGSDPDADWTNFATVTGSVVVDPVTGDTLSIDLTYPVAVTLDTETLGTGSYDIRVYGCDIEGNCNVTTADIATIVVVEEGLRAYIQAPYASAPATLELYAFNYLHDTVIDYVTFQYAEETALAEYNWITVGIDGAASDRGDVLFHRGTATAYYELTDLPVAEQHQMFNVDELFWDADEDGYSERDPIIWDGGQGFAANGTYEASEDIVLMGDAPPEGATLTVFPATFFHTDDVVGDAAFTQGEWIFEHNAEEGDNGQLDLWHVHWDVSGLNGDYVVRAVATDIYSATDEGDIPMVSVAIDPEPPYATITQLTLPDGTTLDPAAVPSLYVEGSHGWFMLEAETDAADISHIVFEYSTNGGATWTELDINDDNDFYADINDMPGFQMMDAPGVPYGDEIFLDDGDFVYGPGDIVLYDGGNGVVNTPYGTPLIPLTTEDADPATDSDGDGMYGEDPFDAEDHDAPYLVYFYIADLPFLSDGDVFFRAVAHDQSGNFDEANTEQISVLVGESEPPVADVIWVKTPDGTELDVLQTISDGDGVDIIGANPEDLTLSVFVTAEDNQISGALSIDLLWRVNPDCYPDLEPWENPWLSMADGGFTTVADSPPEYTFTVDMQALIDEYGDAAIVFFPQAIDQGGNATPAPVNPYALRLMTNQADITTALPATVSPGDEFWFEAELAMPVDGATVAFYYAPRILDVEIDATRVSQAAPYVALNLDVVMAATPGPECHVDLYINGDLANYHEDLSLVVAPTKMDYTVNGVDQIEFGAPVDPADEIFVSYNMDVYDAIGSGDSYPPYTAAWDAGAGGVPVPPADCDAYDIIAVATIGTVASDECSLVEAQCSEGQLLFLVGDEAPDMSLYMKGGNNAVPGAFWPGNPSFDSVAGLAEWKMSGIEHQVFAVHEDGGVPVEVDLLLTDQAGTETVVPMVPYELTAATVPMTFTMYEADYAIHDILYPVENVWLTLGGNEYEMAEIEAGIWQIADVPVPVGATTSYSFFVDMVGDDFGTVLDARNMRDVGGTDVSDVKVPPVPFWFADLGNEAPVPAASAYFGSETAVWQIRLMATDIDENVGYTAPVLMIYDPVAPAVDELTLESLRFNEVAPYPKSWVQAFDPTPGDFNIITVDQVIWEYCPNYAAPAEQQVWIYLGDDDDPTGGWNLDVMIPDPEGDGYDNDGDGQWDEADESTSLMALRAWARDDGYNTGGPLVIEFTLDSTDPEAVVTAPSSGEVFPFSGGPFEITADITDSEEDIAYVQFQFDAGGGWEDIDITPEWDGDDPWDAEPPYAVMFDPVNYLDEEDGYVRIRAMAVDTAGNQDGDAPEILIAINDITGPSALPMWARTEGGPAWMPLADPQTAIQGDAEIRVTVFDPTGTGNIHRCDLEYDDGVADAWVLIGSEEVSLGGSSTTVDFDWNLDAIAEGSYMLRAWCYDIDMNPLDEDPITVSIRVDHTGPAVVYEPMGAEFAGFVHAAPFMNDGVPEQSSLVIVPDAWTGDVTFLIATPSHDCLSIVLQYQEQPNTDPGLWNDFDGFDYEPNLNFTYEDTYYHVWRLLVDDWNDEIGPGGLDLAGPYHWRALATDYAGNANGVWDANNNWSEYHADPTDPVGVSLTHNLQADQVASGDDVTFNFEGTDALTDVAAIRFEWRYAGGTWTVIDPDPATPEVEPIEVTYANIDTEFPRWYGEVTWTTPYPLVQDETVEVQAVFYDTAGNEGTYALDSGTITVEDNIAPDNTKLVYLASDLYYVGDPGGSGDPVFDCEGGDHAGLFIENSTSGPNVGVYNAGTDIPIDFGNGGGVLTNGVAGLQWAGGTNLWPRYVDESVIGGDHPILFSGAIFLVARTQGADTGIERVEFWVENAAGDLLQVGVDECEPEYAEFGAQGGLWQCVWDSEATGQAGNALYPDGDYTIYLRAVDLEGNVEEVDADGSRLVTVDNTAPMGTPDADPLTEEVETSYGEIERNGAIQLFARTDSEVEDHTVTFYYKRSRDLNTGDEWTPVSNDWGVDDNDFNPDDTRPFVFDWDLNKMDYPLVVGESYDVAVATTDMVGNGETHIDAFDDGRFVTFTVVDTQAPCATITEIARETGHSDPIVWPHLYDMIYARDLDYVEAAILDYAPDAIRVEFMYAPEGGTTPTLIDADLDEVAPYTWRITNWDLSALTPGVVYDVFAVAYDDIGNFDFDEETGRPSCGPAFKLVYDNSPPSFEADLSHLTECPQEGFGFTVYPSCWQQGWDEESGPSLPDCGRLVPFGYAGAAAGTTYNIEITTEGDAGSAMFRYNVDGGSWSGTLLTGSNVLLQEGVYLGFVDGHATPSFTAGSSYSFDVNGLVYDLVFTSSDVDIDRDRIFWEYKFSAEPDGDEYWRFDRMSPLVLYDGATQRYSTTWEINGLSGVYDLRLTVYDLAGNRHTMVMAEGVVIDSEDPEIAITNIVIHDPAGGDDTTIDPADFGTVIDVTPGDILELWVTANDNDELLPEHLETGVASIIFEVYNAGDTAWRELGMWQAPSGTEVPLEVVASQMWNTSGLMEGDYLLRAWAMDERCNRVVSGTIMVSVLDQVPPRARIAAFDPWQPDHGDDLTTYCDIYAIAYSDASISQVQFQYWDEAAGDEGEWIPIGIATDYEPDCGDSPDEGRGDLWYTTLDLGMFDVGQTITFRAVASDEVPNQDESPPTIDATIVEHADGSLNLVATGGEIVTGMNLVMVGGADPDEIVVTVEMADAVQYPHVMYTKPVPASLGGGACWIEMTRMIDNATRWSGTMNIDESDCGKFEVFANGLNEGVIDMVSSHVWTWEVTNALGSNGTAMVPGYMNEDTEEETDYLYATGTIPSGTGSDWSSCFTLFPSPAPMMNVDQARFLQLIERTCYYIGMPDDYNGDIGPGYWPVLTIDYDEVALAAALGDAWAVKEPYLTIRVWDADDGEWQGQDISHISVDTDRNQVSFTVQSVDYDYPFYAIFAPAAEAPIVVESFTPSSVKYGRWNWTDADPVITAMLYAGGVEHIDPETIELWIDGQLYASVLDWTSADNYDTWTRGNGVLEVNRANPDGTIWELIYRHSFRQEDWLREADNPHSLNILYKHDGGLDEWIELLPDAPGALFYVDETAPLIEFHGGWVGNPLLANVSGYLNPAQSNDMLTIKLFDAGAGIYVRPDHPEWVWDCDCTDDIPPTPWDAQHPGVSCPPSGSDDVGCWVAVDWSIKYDLWLVEHGDGWAFEDDQSDIDEIEERLLLHQGTADELIPYMTPPLYSMDPEVNTYSPEDTLYVRLPVVGGGHLIQDGDILEVTLYTSKSIDQSHGGDDIYGDTAIDTLWMGENYIYVYHERYDSHSQELHVYDSGVLDYAWNMGSKYVEQRFIVDMSAPEVTLLSPSGGYAVPGEAFTFRVAVDDEAGLGDVTVVLRGPGGEVIEIDDLTIENGVITGTVDDGLPLGNYTIEVTVADKVGNTAVVTIPVTTESRTLALTESYIYPNPYNPGNGDNAMVHFSLSRGADVTFKVYDFAGEYVATLDPVSLQQGGTYDIPWAGQASDGTPLANGAYMIRVTADDGTAKKAATIKAVIWRE